MRHTLRASLLIGLMSASLAGCCCGGQCSSFECKDAVVTIDEPAEGAVVNSTFGVTVRARESAAADAGAFAFKAAQLRLDDGGILEGTVDGGAATFTVTGASTGEHTLTVTVTKDACGPTAASPSNTIAPVTRTVTVQKDCVPTVTGITFPQDVNGDGRINSVELPPGTELQVRIAATCLSGTRVRVKNYDTNTTLGSAADFSSGIATASVPVSADGTLDLFAELLSDGTPVNAPTNNPQALASVTIARLKPTCSNTTVLVNGPNTDQTAGNSTFDLRATGTVGPTVTAAFFRVENGSSTTPTAPAQGAFSAALALPQTTATYELTLVAQDADGNECTDTKTLSVDYTPLVVAITSPAGVDGGPASANVTPIGVVASVTKGGAPFSCATADGGTGFGTCASVTRKAGSETPVVVDRKDVLNGSTAMNVPFGASGLYTIEVTVTDALGNTGVARVDVAVTLTTCGVAFTQPASCPVTIFPSNLHNGTYQVSFSSGNCSGRSARLKVDGTVVGTGIVASGGAAGPFPVTFNASQTVTLRAEVDDAMGVPAYAECVATVDLSQPLITNPALADGGTSILVASGDSDSATPGAQRSLQFTATVPNSARIDACITQASVALVDGGTDALAACSDNMNGWYLLKTGVTPPAAQSNYSVAGFSFPEGTYQLKLLVVDGASINASPAVPLWVDVTRPCLTGLTFDKDNGAGNASFANDTHLSIAEYAQTAVPLLSFALGCGDTPATLASTGPVTLKQVSADGTSTSALSAGLTPTITAGASGYTADIAGLSGTGALRLWVQLKDLAGNVNLYQGNADPAKKSLTLALTAPSCTIASPSATLLGMAAVPDGGLTVTVTTDTATAIASSITAGATSLTGGPLAPSAGIATLPFGGITGDQTWTVAATCTDIAGNGTSAVSHSVELDLVPPTIAFVSPTNGSTYFDVAVPTQLTVGGAEGRAVGVVSLQADGGTQNIASLTVSSGSASSNLTSYPKGVQTVTASVADVAGNAAAAQVGIYVNSTQCVITPAGGYQAAGAYYLNRASAPSGTVAISATTDCPLASVDLSFGGSVIATTTANAGGVITFPSRTVTTGEVYRLSIASVHTDYTVDLTAPTFTSFSLSSGTGCPSGSPCITTATPPTNALYFVAASANRNVIALGADAGSGGYLPNSSAVDQTGATFNLTVNGASDTGLRITYRGASTDTTLTSGTPKAITLTQVAAVGGAPPGSPLTLSLVDAANNTTDVYAVSSAAVDVVPPAAPGATLGAVTRNGLLPITWATVYNDGANTSSGDAIYEVVWSTQTLGGSLATEDLYMGAGSSSSLVTREPDIASAAHPLGTTLHLPAMDSAYYVAVRARDGVGNLSTFAAPATTPSGAWTEIDLQTDAGTNFGALAVADLVGTGGYKDVVVGLPRTPSATGAVFLYTGGPGLTNLVGCPAASCQTLLPPNAGNKFGWDLSADGDTDGDGRADLVIGNPGWSAGSGRVLLYFGTNAATLSTSAGTYVEIDGNAASYQFGMTVKIIKDLDGDGRDEILVGTPYYWWANANASLIGIGRVYIFKGRSLASWQAIGAVATVANADWIIEGPTDGSGNRSYGTSAAGQGFAYTPQGITSLSDIDGDGKNDLGIVDSFEVASTFQTWVSGTLLDGGTFASSAAHSSFVGNQVSVSDPAAFNDNGLGRAAVGGVRFTDAGVPDLVLAYPSIGRVGIYGGSRVQGGLVPTWTAFIGQGTATAKSGGNIAVGDLNGDGLNDLVIADLLSPTSTSGLWTFFQTPRGGFDFNCTGDTEVCYAGAGSPSHAQFWATKLSIGVAARVTVMDVTGDALPDVIVSDSSTKTVRVFK